MATKNNYGHWSVNKDFNPEEYVGFVYEIENILTGRKYIGQKSLFSHRRVPVKGRKNKKRVTTESNWREYTGSSKWLNEDIKTIGKDKFKFTILSLYESKSELNYAEVVEIVRRDALNQHYYNASIPPIRNWVKEL